MKRPLWLSFISPLLLVLAGACAAPSQSAKTSSAPKQQEFVVAKTASGNSVVTVSGNTVAPRLGDHLICEYEETVGSHIPRRICRSKADVERVQDETQQAMRDYRAPGTNDPKAALAPGH